MSKHQKKRGIRKTTVLVPFDLLKKAKAVMAKSLQSIPGAKATQEGAAEAALEYYIESIKK